MTPAALALVAVAGLISGAINAVAGGGSLILFPALVAAGLPTVPANVTNSVANWPGYAGGVLGFRAEIADQRHRLLGLVVTTVLGSATGSVLLLATPSSAFNLIVPVLVLLASLILAVQPRIRRLVGTPREDDARHAAARYVAVFVASVYGGYFGGALGVILIGILALTIPDTLRRINALKSALSLANATVSLLIFALFGPVYWLAVAVAAPTTLIGGYVGAKLARRLNDRVLRWCVVVFGVLAAAYLFLR